MKTNKWDTDRNVTCELTMLSPLKSQKMAYIFIYLVLFLQSTSATMRRGKYSIFTTIEVISRIKMTPIVCHEIDDTLNLVP